MRKAFLPFFVALTLGASAAEPEIPVKAKLDNPKSSSLILVPDPQSYVKWASMQPLFELQTAWIAQNVSNLNIKAALFTGDMVEHNDKQISNDVTYPNNGDQSSVRQWKSVSRALERLDNRIPYILCQGNHDAGFVSAEHRRSHMSEYFPVDRNICWEKTLVATAANAQGDHTLENAAYEIEMPGWGKVLVVAWEFAPRDEIIGWTKNLVESEKYKNHHVIILTHSFLTHKHEVIKKEGYKLEPRNWAADIMEKLVYQSTNIDLILCGHAGTTMPWPENPKSIEEIDYSTTLGFRVEKTKSGKDVPIMMFNSQTGDGQWNGNGGDCWLRILEFKPDGKTVKVHTFSPLYALSKFTKNFASRKAPYDEFEFRID